MSEQQHTPASETDLQEALHEHDDWFRHSPDEPHHQAAHGDFNVSVVIGFLAATIIVVLGVAVIVVPWYIRMINDRAVEVRELNPNYAPELETQFSEWDAQLHGEPQWLDEQTNTVRIPLEVAKRVVADRYGTGDLPAWPEESGPEAAGAEGQ